MFNFASYDISSTTLSVSFDVDRGCSPVHIHFDSHLGTT